MDGAHLELRVDRCRYMATVARPEWMQGTIQCVDRLPSGAETVVDGLWEARRAGR